MDGRLDAIGNAEAGVRERYRALSSEGYRTLGVAVRNLDRHDATRDDEAGTTFLGFVVPERPAQSGDRPRARRATRPRHHMVTRANFGNMFSMAGASLFLQLLPRQILLTNLLTDFPEMTIPTDRVDEEWIHRPHRWNISSTRQFMLGFGRISSVFDYVTFGVLLVTLRASAERFRSGWFVESVVSASLIVLVIRTRRPFFRNRPSVALRYRGRGSHRRNDYDSLHAARSAFRVRAAGAPR